MTYGISNRVELRATQIFIFSLAAVFFAAELIFGVRYPVFRDELYYIDCANHLAAGYIDHPALSIFILAVWKFIFGTSILSLRILPALTGAAVIILTARITKEMGGSPAAQLFSAAAIFSMPLLWAMGGFYSMNVFDFLFWALLFYILVKIINTRRSSLWLWFGLVAGLGLLNKISVGYLGAGIFAAIVCTKERSWLKDKYFWLGGMIAVLIFSPYVIWNAVNGYPTLEFISNATRLKNAVISPLAFFMEQILQAGPLNLLVWLTAIISMLFLPSLKKYRAIAFTYVFLFIILTANKGKPYYLGAIYPVLFSAGAAAVYSFFQNRKVRFILPVYSAITVISFALLSPLVLPVLGPQELAAYIQKTGINPGSGERSRAGALPQHFADRFGWEEMASKIGGVYNSLPPEEKKYAAILCRNYGEAGAVNYYGRKFGLPEALSGHNSNWLWGLNRLNQPDADTITTLVVIGYSKEDAEESFEEVTIADTIITQFSMPYESNLPVLICRKPKLPMQELWLRVKMYI